MRIPDHVVTQNLLTCIEDLSCINQNESPFYSSLVLLQLYAIGKEMERIFFDLSPANSSFPTKGKTSKGAHCISAL